MIGKIKNQFKILTDLIVNKKTNAMSRFLSTQYTVECFTKDRKLKWSDIFNNLVVTEGLNDSLDKHFKASGYTSVWYVGLTNMSPTVNAADTMGSHSGWAELTSYDEAQRADLILGTISEGGADNSESKASFTMNDAISVGGAFVVSDNGKGGFIGVLYGVGAFAGGDRLVAPGDTLNVTVTVTAAAA
jgi:hypothetical protein